GDVGGGLVPAGGRREPVVDVEDCVPGVVEPAVPLWCLAAASLDEAAAVDEYHRGTRRAAAVLGQPHVEVEVFTVDRGVADRAGRVCRAGVAHGDQRAWE